MNILKATLGYVGTNAYFIESNSGIVVIDPGMMTEMDCERVMTILDGRKVIAILLTHGHFDHIAGVDWLVDIFGCPVYISAKDELFLSDPHLNASDLLNQVYGVASDYKIINSSSINVDGLIFKIEETPGHTHGSLTFIVNDNAFVGDFIMKNSIGRTDLPTGSMTDMVTSIKRFCVEHEGEGLMLYPGHGDITRLDQEITLNPFLTQILD